MKKITFILFFLPFLAFCQWNQVGQDISTQAEGQQPLALSGDGNSLAIGFNDYELNSSTDVGAVSVYHFVQNEWIQKGQSLYGIPDPTNFFGVSFGDSVALNNDGTILAVGASNFQGVGEVRIFEFISNQWIQIGEGVKGGFDERFGASVRLSADGSVVAIMAIFGPDKVYERMGDDWLQKGSDLPIYGQSVDLNASGDMVVLGNPFFSEGAFQRGLAQVFQFSEGEWSQVGQDIVGENQRDQLGRSVAINTSGSIIAIATPNSDFHGPDTGHSEIYKLENNQWVQIGTNINGTWQGSRFGASIDLNSQGNIVCMASPGANNGNGVVKAYKNIGETWLKLNQDMQGEKRAAGTVTMNFLGNRVAFITMGQHINSSEEERISIFEYDGSLGIPEVLASSFSIYPNPGQNILNISNDSSLAIDSVKIYNTLGVQLYAMKNHNPQSTISIEISHLPSSLYIVAIESGSAIQTHNFVKN